MPDDHEASFEGHRYVSDDEFHVDLSEATPCVIVPVDGPGHVCLLRGDLIAMVHALDVAEDREGEF
jgi:hypothetical protein